MVLRVTLRRRRAAAVYAVKGALVAAAIIGARYAMDAVGLAEVLERVTYASLMKLPSLHADPPAVVVLDISHLPGGKASEKDPSVLEPTPRENLSELLAALTKVGPSAVGLDIDFSATPRGPITDEDASFFNDCLKMSEKVPVRLGVARTMLERPERWLGLPKYRPLAGALWMQDANLERIPVWVSFKGGDEAQRLPSLGAALAEAAEVRASWLSKLSWAVVEAVRVREVATDKRNVSFIVGESLADYRSLQSPVDITIPRVSAQDILKNVDRLKGRIVLIGDVNSSRDSLADPLSGKARPGVYFHAAMVQTLAHGGLYGFTHGFGLLLDIVITMVVVGLVIAKRWRRGFQAEAEVKVTEWKVISRFVLFAFIAWALLLLARILWLDFFAVLLLLFLHPRTSGWIAKWWHRTLGKGGKP